MFAIASEGTALPLRAANGWRTVLRESGLGRVMFFRIGIVV
jgi:hypothetical protein